MFCGVAISPSPQGSSSAISANYCVECRNEVVYGGAKNLDKYMEVMHHIQNLPSPRKFFVTGNVAKQYEVTHPLSHT